MIIVIVHSFRSFSRPSNHLLLFLQHVEYRCHLESSTPSLQRSGFPVLHGSHTEGAALCLCVYRCLGILIYLSIDLSIYLFVYLSIYLSVCLSTDAMCFLNHLMMFVIHDMKSAESWYEAPVNWVVLRKAFLVALLVPQSLALVTESLGNGKLPWIS